MTNYRRYFFHSALAICAFLAAINLTAAGELCNDGIDNDGDGATDCQDQSCASLSGCRPRYKATLNLKNNCQGEDLYVTVNAKSDWTSGGRTICKKGTTCKIPPGSYGYDASHDGLDFHIGESPDEATKAEVSYVLKPAGNGPPELSYDISLITMGGSCPNTCKDSACCQTRFNQPLRIYQTGKCSCLYCDTPDCAAAFLYPTDNSKQANCPASRNLTIEFCPTQSCAGEHGGIRACNSSERKICADCTGDMIYCCPEQSWGSSHECLCQEKSQWCAALPDSGSGCGSTLANYCYVSNPPQTFGSTETEFKFSINNMIDDTASQCPLYGGPSITIWIPGSNNAIGVPYGISRTYNADLSDGGGLGIQVNFWYWDRVSGIPIQSGSSQQPQNPDNSGDNFLISQECEITKVEPAFYGKGQRTSVIADVSTQWAGSTCMITVATNDYTSCVTKNCCSPPIQGYANACKTSDAYVSECAIQ
ncbi:hypothetical protein Thiosp_02678 [Thiorhodovibrio litoralis]|nr:hypothetical protein Thiosp_02678 [Thiorhodovibrio litoralis]